jgi:hypothetical protein
MYFYDENLALTEVISVLDSEPDEELLLLEII